MALPPPPPAPRCRRAAPFKCRGTRMHGHCPQASGHRAGDSSNYKSTKRMQFTVQLDGAHGLSDGRVETGRVRRRKCYLLEATISEASLHAPSPRPAVAAQHAAPGLRLGQRQRAAVAAHHAQVARAGQRHVDALAVPEEAAGKGADRQGAWEETSDAQAGRHRTRHACVHSGARYVLLRMRLKLVQLPTGRAARAATMCHPPAEGAVLGAENVAHRGHDHRICLVALAGIHGQHLPGRRMGHVGGHGLLLAT